MASVDLPATWRRGQRGWPAGFVLVQLPNAPLLVGLTAGAVARLTSGDASAYAEAISDLGLAVFAYLELTGGANGFRRLLGAVVLAYLVHSLGQALR